jgi:hypothetical protein
MLARGGGENQAALGAVWAAIFSDWGGFIGLSALVFCSAQNEPDGSCA